MSMLLKRQTFGNPINNGKLLSREEAETLLISWVPNQRLQLHMRQVGYLLRAWAKEKLNADETLQWKWEMAGLLHDADWDQWPVR